MLVFAVLQHSARSASCFVFLGLLPVALTLECLVPLTL